MVHMGREPRACLSKANTQLAWDKSVRIVSNQASGSAPEAGQSGSMCDILQNAVYMLHLAGLQAALHATQEAHTAMRCAAW